MSLAAFFKKIFGVKGDRIVLPKDSPIENRNSLNEIAEKILNYPEGSFPYVLIHISDEMCKYMPSSYNYPNQPRDKIEDYALYLRNLVINDMIWPARFQIPPEEYKPYERTMREFFIEMFERWDIEDPKDLPSYPKYLEQSRFYWSKCIDKHERKKNIDFMGH